MMADHAMGLSQAEMASLKETLCAQQQLLQKLYNELDVEREASASAASEALSMILRLQGEKAAVKMEAEQYKRLAEEKMCHAEESLAVFEDLMYQKEMEVAALDYQVQAYRYKLLSLGCIDPGGGEIRFPENLLQRNETLLGETSVQSLGRRNSAPPIPLKYLYQRKGSTERESSTSPAADSVSRIPEQNGGQDINEQASESDRKTDISSSGNINSYWEQIRKLDERVKEIAGPSFMNSRSETRSPSPNSQSSSSNPYNDQGKKKVKNDLHAGNTEKLLDVTGDTSSTNVYDVFEVPQADQSTNDCQTLTKDEGKMVLQFDERLETPESFSPEALKSHGKDDTDWLKKLLLSTNRDYNLRRSSNGAPINCHLAIVRPTTSVGESEPKFHQLSRKSEIIEVEGQAVRYDSPARVDELRLLNEIKEQLNSLQSEIRSWKKKKTCQKDELPLAYLKEAMLHFWM